MKTVVLIIFLTSLLFSSTVTMKCENKNECLKTVNVCKEVGLKSECNGNRLKIYLKN